MCESIQTAGLSLARLNPCGRKNKNSIEARVNAGSYIGGTLQAVEHIARTQFDGCRVGIPYRPDSCTNFEMEERRANLHQARHPEPIGIWVYKTNGIPCPIIVCYAKRCLCRARRNLHLAKSKC
jgi:hypothetical protein